MNACALLLFVVAAATASTQYHSQDEWGQYAYGYSGGPSAKHEQRTADGVTRGGYSYVDANGLIQSVNYVADPVNGFRAAGTNIPTNNAAVLHPVVPVVHDAPAVPVVHAVPLVHAVPAVASIRSAYSSAVVHHDAAPASVVETRHLQLHAPPVPVLLHPSQQQLKVSGALTPAGTSNLHYPELHSVHLLAARRKKRSVLGPYPYYHPGPAVVHHRAIVPVVKPVATSYTSVVRHDPVPVYHTVVPVAHVYDTAPVPVPHVYAVAPAAAVVAPVKTQYHAQDEHGQYAYGYADGESAKSETRYADGTTVGGYSYVDDGGRVQTVHYTAGADGFTAAGTNIPVHHV